MRVVTIEVKYESMRCHDDKLKGCREMWRAAGLIVYVVGPLDKNTYHQAENLVKNLCIEMHIPMQSIRKTGKTQSGKSTFTTETRRMF